MAGCPNAECRDKVDGHQTTLYGENGRGGVVGEQAEQKRCIDKRVPKSWLWKFVSAFGVAIIIGGYLLFSGVQAADTKATQNSKDIAENGEQIKELTELSKKNELQQAGVKKDLEHIQETLKRIEGALP